MLGARAIRGQEGGLLQSDTLRMLRLVASAVHAGTQVLLARADARRRTVVLARVHLRLLILTCGDRGAVHASTWPCCNVDVRASLALLV